MTSPTRGAQKGGAIITRFLRRLLPAVVLVFGGLIGAFLPLTDLGYLDLAHGRHIVTTGELQHPPVQAVPEGSGTPAAWLGSWLLFTIHRLGEEPALRIFSALLTAGGALLLYLASPGPVGFIVSIAAVSIAAPELEISTLLFSWPLLAALAFAASTMRNASKWRMTIPPLIFLLWSTLNREAAVGLFILGLIVLELLVERYVLREAGEAPEDWHPLGFLAGTTLFALLLSLAVFPGGYSNLQNPVRSALLMKQAGVASWASVALPEHTAFFIYAALAGLAVGLRTWRMNLSASVALATSAGLSLVSRHFVIAFAALAAPWLSRFLKSQYDKLGEPRSRLLRPAGITTGTFLLAAILILSPFLNERRDHPFEGAVQVISKGGVSASLFNVPEAGGLISWVAGPNRIPYSDLRPASLVHYETQFESEDTATAVLSWNLAQELASSGKLNGPDLRPLYLDDEALVYARPAEDTFEHVEPLKKPEDYVPEVLPLAIEELFDHLERHRPSKRVLSLLGRLLIREGREEEALEIFEAALRLNPDDLDTLTELSWLYDHKRMYGLAERSSRHALELGGNGELTHILARALYGQGRFEEAAGFFERVLVKDQGNLAALRAIVDAYQRLDRTDLALGHRQRLAVVEESTIERLIAEAEQKRRGFDFLGAAGAYQLAHEVRPSDTAILWDRVVVLLADRRIEPAADALKILVEHDPTHGLAHLILGSLCAREIECEPEEAREHLETFLELQPEDINAEIARRELAALAKRP